MSATATNAHVRARDDRSPLPRLLRLDAALSGTAGLALAVGAPWLDGVLGAPATFLVPLGVFLVVFAGTLVLLAWRGAPAGGVKAVVAGNALWVAVSVVAVVLDWLTLTTAGTVFALLQAAAVAGLAELQLQSLRRASRSPATAA